MHRTYCTYVELVSVLRPEVDARRGGSGGGVDSGVGRSKELGLGMPNFIDFCLWSQVRASSYRPRLLSEVLRLN